MSSWVGGSLIRDSLEALVADREFVRTLEWWARHGSSYERMLQVFWGRILDKMVRERSGGKLAVTCEVQYTDFVIYDPELADLQSGYVTPLERIELKAWAGWSTGAYQFVGFANDVVKAEHSRTPAAAVVTVFHAGNEIEWMKNNRGRTENIRDADAELRAFPGLVDRNIRLLNLGEVAAEGSWKSLDFGAWVFVNAPALVGSLGATA